MIRTAVAALLLTLSPAALACGMYMPDHELLADVLDQIDSLDADAVETEDVSVFAALEVAPDSDALTDVFTDALADAIYEADADGDIEVVNAANVETDTRRARRQKRDRRKARR